MLAHRTEDLREQAPLPVIWQYESPHYEVASSLSSLSLLAPEAPTQPQPPVAPRPKATRRLPAIDEIDTIPPAARPAASPAVSLALTAPRSAAAQESTPRALVPAPPAVESLDTASWTAGAASNSTYARIISGTAHGDWRKQLAFNPLDRLRWWLLRPGRIEFLLWLVGTLLLLLVSCALLFALAFSFESGAGIANIPANSESAGSSITAQASVHGKLPPLQVVLTRAGPYAPGELVGVRGQGFSPHSSISFTLDGGTPIQDEHGHTAILPTDAHGAFSGTLWLGVGTYWTVGHHTIVARDKTTGRQFKMSVELVAALNPTSPTAQVTSTSTISIAPGITPTTVPTTAATTTPVPQGSPGNKSPIPSTPSPSPSPASTHTPTATPTTGTTPTPTTTVTATATATNTSQATPGVTPASGLSSALNQSGDPPISTPLSTASPLVWVMAACYTLSMLLLGVAGILYKRRPRQAKAS